MVWNPRKQNRGLFAFYRKMARIRKENAPLRRGDLRFLYAKGRTVGFERFTPDGNKLAVFINNSEKNSTVDLEEYFAGRDFIDIVGGQPLKRKKSCTVPAFGFVILSPKEGTK
jgi:glycosidase